MSPSASASVTTARADAVQAVARELLHRDGLNKIVHSESTPEAGNTARGQDMVRPGGIVAGRLRRIIADKDRSRIADVRQVFLIAR